MESTCLFLLPVNKAAASLTATRLKMTRSKVRFRVGWARGQSGERGRKEKAVRGRVDRPFMFIGCEVAAEFRIEEQHVLLSKIHMLAHRHAHTQPV